MIDVDEATGVETPLAGSEGPQPDRQAEPMRRRGRPPTRTVSTDRGSAALQGRTVKTYELNDQARRTAGYLRLVLGQRDIPNAATVAVEQDTIVIEWAG